MDKPRSITWTISGVDAFTEMANKELVRLKILKEDDEPMMPLSILQAHGNRPSIFRMALECSLGISGDELDTAVEAYPDGKQELGASMLEAFFLAEDPLVATSFRQNWTRSRETAKARIEAEMANPPAEIDPGKPPDSESSN